MGLSRDVFLEALRRNFGVRLGKDPAEEGKMVRALARRMPDIIYDPVGEGARKTSAKLVYPSFYGMLKRGRRTEADYDTSTHVGAASFRQFGDAVAMMLDLNPKGLRRDTFCNMLREKYSHDLDFELARSLVERLPEVAIWRKSDEYGEYDAIRRARPPPPPPRPSSLRSRRQAWRDRVLERFLQWYDDPPSASQARFPAVSSPR